MYGAVTRITALFGRRNPEIFALIADELADRLVAAPPVSQRQLRRIIYG